jgi:hypothetical protein
MKKWFAWFACLALGLAFEGACYRLTLVDGGEAMLWPLASLAGMVVGMTGGTALVIWGVYLFWKSS